MSSHISSKSSPIVIVGAGVFGLTTAIHLAERGYTNVKVLDKQAYHQSQYSYDKGCDAASADINKVIRAAYGHEYWYQDLAVDAISKWKKWNDEIKTGKTLPPGFSNEDKLFVNNGQITLTSDSTLPKFERTTKTNMEKAGLGDMQIDLSDADDVARARSRGFGFALDAFNLKDTAAQLDIQSGFAYADRACRFALYKAETLGAQFIGGGAKGTFSNFLEDADSRVTGVRTADGVSHPAELTIMACGGWTPSLVTQLDNLCETTAGSVAIFQLPANDKALWDRFAPENFPTYSYNLRHGKSGGLYGFARTPTGSVKIGYRGTKYTNPQTQADGLTRSIPITRWTPQSIRQIPITGVKVIKGFVQRYLPELMGCEMSSRICWYTDSYDNQFVVDFVPGRKGVMVATGGSGHGFKFLPNLGRYVVDRIEGRESEYLRRWRWRGLEEGVMPKNRIMEGEGSERSLLRQALTEVDGGTKLLSRL